jgi:ribonuclease VapC
VRLNGNRFVLDASALLCSILRERGADLVEEAIVNGALISTVNFAEVVSRLTELGFSSEDAYKGASDTDAIVEAFTETQARLCGEFRMRTRRLELGLGDRACLAVGRDLGLPVLTADRIWAELDLGVEVVVCR